jgi:arylsulfatase A-like enzyme
MKNWVSFAAISALLFSSCYNKSQLAKVELPAMEYEPHTYDSAYVFADDDYDYTPRLVIGITVDQMRYDYLTRFDADFLNEPGGFQRLIHEGVSIENLHYNYVPTYTGPGHASIFTGTTPA